MYWSVRCRFLGLNHVGTAAAQVMIRAVLCVDRYTTLRAALEAMAAHMKSHGVTRLSMPRIGELTVLPSVVVSV